MHRVAPADYRPIDSMTFRILLVAPLLLALVSSARRETSASMPQPPSRQSGPGQRLGPLRAPNPGHRYVSAMAYDPGRDRTVLFGGYACDRQTAACGVVADPWEWDGARWRRGGEP